MTKKQDKPDGTTDESTDQTPEVFVQGWTSFERQAPPHINEWIDKKVEILLPGRRESLPDVERDIYDFDCHDGR